MPSKQKKPYRNGKMHVMSEKCSTCIFRPGNLMDLEPGTVKTLTERSLRDGGAIPCHKTTYGQAEGEAICRGFFDLNKSLPLKLANACGIIVFIEESTLHETGSNVRYKKPRWPGHKISDTSDRSTIET